MTCPSACCESKVKAHQCECVNNFNHENMNEQQTPLTAEEIRQQLCAKSASNQRLFYTDMKSYMLGFYNGYDQQPGQLQQELADAQEKYTSLVRSTNKELVDLSVRLNNATIELEQMKAQLKTKILSMETSSFSGRSIVSKNAYLTAVVTLKEFVSSLEK